MSKRYFVYVIASIFLAGLLFWSFETAIHTRLLSTTTWSPPVTAATPEDSSIPPTQSGIRLLAEGSEYMAAVQDGASVLSAMKALQAAGQFTFSGREYPALGFFVESIQGKKNQSGYYWFLYVNGKESEKGASQTFLSSGDTVEWKYKKGY